MQLNLPREALKAPCGLRCGYTVYTFFQFARLYSDWLFGSTKVVHGNTKEVQIVVDDDSPYRVLPRELQGNVNVDMHDSNDSSFEFEIACTIQMSSFVFAIITSTLHTIFHKDFT